MRKPKLAIKIGLLLVKEIQIRIWMKYFILIDWNIFLNLKILSAAEGVEKQKHTQHEGENVTSTAILENNLIRFTRCSTFQPRNLTSKNIYIRKQMAKIFTEALFFGERIT